MTPHEVAKYKPLLEAEVAEAIAAVNQELRSSGLAPLTSREETVYSVAFTKGALWRTQLAESASIPPLEKSLLTLPPHHEN